ncbi:hypothetical protein CMUST_13255 [Corynebacterium mustelae]|uniref:Uncharacterized protein n=1 Tax=Corynebacterium mustelae TaxID=571915 RepID=A0A0G3H2G6_9CORY|nr:hypothetical protein [Corynebacterium mustelae]AKK06945.1 hypothetical protein CMUST_13255 [Corynebacterium mustelae]
MKRVALIVAIGSALMTVGGAVSPISAVAEPMNSVVNPTTVPPVYLETEAHVLSGYERTHAVNPIREGEKPLEVPTGWAAVRTLDKGAWMVHSISLSIIVLGIVLALRVATVNGVIGQRGRRKVKNN